MYDHEMYTLYKTCLRTNAPFTTWDWNFHLLYPANQHQDRYNVGSVVEAFPCLKPHTILRRG